MRTAISRSATTVRWLRPILCAGALLAPGSHVLAVGTAAGTVIENTASVDFGMGGTSFNVVSNTTSFSVAERIDVDVTLASGQIVVSAGDTDRALLFTVTNIGNGNENFLLALDSVLAGDDFDPAPAVPAIYFDTDGSGDFSAADVAYTPGNNDTLLAPDQSIDVFVINDIPASVVDGQVGRSQLTASASTGTGPAGTVFAGAGDGNVDAVVGTSGGDDADAGEYFVDNIVINFVKGQVVLDPSGGSEPVPGATLTYSITVEVAGSGTAAASAFRDAIPTYSTFVPNSITLNGVSISDAMDGDAGEFDTAGAPTVVVRLGDLTQADGIQTVVFQVTID